MNVDDTSVNITAVSDIAAVSDNDTTYVYFYSESASAIREITISGLPVNGTTENFNSSDFPPLENNHSLYPPLAAVQSGDAGARYLFWAGRNSTTGGADLSSPKSNNDSGYSMISGRNYTINSKWSNETMNVPLGNN